ncbi:uncharacterized protein LAJ45_11707 [Morchella importuna]|uniref:MADS-box domain-containing protein n=1 Tax=Morchella conica CCBAS932 TaxID=1392247 RepID=A0A3N4KHR4_9PEZI|nr:uncharacterized protein LAJ45_11707 [Morchella importuna]KAH8144311.1 hypothetical protein LAJ45_11707 [Morchella importuna]RPB10040.1 hypothetical protein P167DRAFT_537971 [Morchella conica CCBAS932]
MGKVIFTTRKGAPDFNLQRKFNRRCQTLFTKASELVYLSQADVYVVVQFPGARTRARVFLSSEGFTPLPLPELKKKNPPPEVYTAAGKDGLAPSGQAESRGGSRCGSRSGTPDPLGWSLAPPPRLPSPLPMTATACSSDGTFATNPSNSLSS